MEKNKNFGLNEIVLIITAYYNLDYLFRPDLMVSLSNY